MKKVLAALFVLSVTAGCTSWSVYPNAGTPVMPSKVGLYQPSGAD